jgi:hypothetical protein
MVVYCGENLKESNIAAEFTQTTQKTFIPAKAMAIFDIIFDSVLRTMEQHLPTKDRSGAPKCSHC